MEEEKGSFCEGLTLFIDPDDPWTWLNLKYVEAVDCPPLFSPFLSIELILISQGSRSDQEALVVDVEEDGALLLQLYVKQTKHLYRYSIPWSLY